MAKEPKETFDPYREALVVEEETLWPADAREAAVGWDEARRRQVERALHRTAELAAKLDYLRVHTGFCRRITVTPDDLHRVAPRTATSSAP
ncbi:MAG: hypothetical protein ACRCT8_04040 [Lacipirellulaceae bacterium]